MSGLGLTPRWGGGNSTLSLAAIEAQLGALVLDADALGLSNGASVSTVEVGSGVQLTAGSHPFVADTAHLQNGHAAIATTGLAHTLANTAYSPISAAGAAPTAWGTSSWTMVAVVNCVTAALHLGGGPYIGKEGDAKVTLGTGGHDFDGSPSAKIFFVAVTNGAAENKWNWFTQAEPSGVQIVSLSYDGARLRQMVNGTVDAADGVADSTIASTPVADPGIGLSDGYAGNASGVNRWYRVAWVPSCVPRTTLRNYHRSLGQRYGLVTL